MPRRQDHIGLALMIPLLVWFIVGSKVLYSSVFMISSALLVVGSLAPDFLEPSSHWTHRGFFHSQKLLKILLIATAVVSLFWLIFYSIFKSQIFLFIGSFLVGYIIHLLMDSRTKMGLPKDDNPTIGFR